MKRFSSRSFRPLAAAAMSACALWACSKPAPEEPGNGSGNGDTPDPVVLENQIQYDGGDLVDIKSVIYTEEDGQYSFWFSPADGITTAAEADEAGGALKITLTNPGTFDLEKDLSELQYSDINVTSESMADVKECKLSFDLASETSVSLSLDLTMASGKTLLAEYDGSCAAAVVPEVQLENQYELNGEISPIASVVAWYSVSENVTEWSFYTQSGVTEPSESAAISIKVNGAPVTLKADLSDTEAVTLVCGNFSNTSTTIGSVDITVEGGNVTVSFDADNGSDRLRAQYSGSFTSGNDFAGSKFSVTKDGTKTVDTGLSTVFRNTGDPNMTFLFGDAASPADASALTGGKYALSVAVPAGFVTENGYVADINGVEISIYEYETYKTLGLDDIESCSFTVRKISDKSVYFSLAAQTNDGLLFEAEWFGDVTEIESIPDIVPVEPEVFKMLITDPSGATKKEEVITEVQVRKELDLNYRGGDPNYGGAVFDAYVFYFCTSMTDDNPDDATYTPSLLVPSYLMDGVEHQLLTEKCPFEFKYTTAADILKLTSYSDDYIYGFSGTCPDDAAVTISRDETTKVWTISFSMTDSISKNYDKGTGNRLVIDWTGTVSKYTGSKTDDMTEEDY